MNPPPAAPGFRMASAEDFVAGAPPGGAGAPGFAWVAVIAIGPSPAEIGRLDDLLGALRHYEPQGAPVILLNDGADAEHLQSLLDVHRVTGAVWAHPRAGRGDAWLGRLTAGLNFCYRRIAAELPGRHVLRLDTDALIVAPFATRLAAVLQTASRAGLVGSVELTADGRAPGSWFEQRVYRMTKLVSRWDHRPYFRTSFFGSRARMRRLLRQAQAHGYRLAYAACGGAYLLTAEALRRMQPLEALDDEQLVAADTLTEDIFFSIVVHACGLKVVEQNTPGDVFGVCWKGLPAHTLPRVVERHHAIIHSVKDHDGFREADTREFFRRRRATGGTRPAARP